MRPDVLPQPPPLHSPSSPTPLKRSRSFASPTKLSLSRFNSELLARMKERSPERRFNSSRVLQPKGNAGREGGVLFRGLMGQKTGEQATHRIDRQVEKERESNGYRLKGDSARQQGVKGVAKRGGDPLVDLLKPVEEKVEESRKSKRRRTDDFWGTKSRSTGVGTQSGDSSKKEEEKRLVEALLKREKQLVLENEHLSKEIEEAERWLRLEEERRERLEEGAINAINRNTTGMLLSSDGGMNEGNIVQLIDSLLKANDSSLAVASASALASQQAMKDDRQEEKELPSVRPLKPKNPLPQLQMFTPLTFQQPQTRILPKSSSSPFPNQPLLEHHTVRGHSHDILKLLSFRIEMTVDTSALQVVSLSSHISSWAKKECGAFLKEVTKGNDVLTTMHAIRSYAILAKVRAGTFIKLERKFGESLLPILTPRERKKREHEDIERPLRRQDYVPYLGEAVLKFKRRTSLEFNVGKNGSDKNSSGGKGSNASAIAGGREDGIELNIMWEIVLDVTGQARSELWADVRAPDTWWQADDRAALKRLTKMFRSLADERGVYHATIALVKLLFG